MPAAEVDVTADLVRRMLRAQHPDLADLPVQRVANGWDNVVFRLGGELAVRMPRREVAAGILLNEQRWLPLLAPRLPLPVPAAVRIGRPGPGYPWPWSIVPFLPGRPASDTPPSDLRAAAVVIGGFLGALHQGAPPDAPANPVRGVPLARRAAAFEQNLGSVAAEVDQAAVTRTWEAALAAPPWDAPGIWLHGDPHPGNILVRDGRVSAVIDFGDITAGDPATDLALAWMMLPAGCHEAFREAYHRSASVRAGEPLWLRARGWALNFALAFLANSADDPRLRAVGRHTLAAVLA
jgi:aminoglycoside phosphotransferase (APT) family kinase protein